MSVSSGHFTSLEKTTPRAGRSSLSRGVVDRGRWVWGGMAGPRGALEALASRSLCSDVVRLCASASGYVGAGCYWHISATPNCFAQEQPQTAQWTVHSER